MSNILTLAHALESRPTRRLPLTAASAPEERETDCPHFGELGLADANAVPPALYSINVHDRRTGELVGKYGLLFFGRSANGLALDRRNALRCALRDADAAWDYDAEHLDAEGNEVNGPPDIGELEAREEYR